MYQKEEALQYVKEYIIDQSEMNLAVDELEKVLELCLKADIEYMLQTGLLKQNKGQYEITDEGLYDDDDAFSHILEELKRNKIKLQGIDLEEFIDEYLDAHEAFLEEKGFLGWEE